MTEQRIAESAGFDVVRRGDAILFVYRATRGPALVAWIAGGLSIITALNALLRASQGAPIAAVVLGPLALLFGFAARAGYRAYRRRSEAPVDDLVRVRADLAAGALLSRDGSRLASLGEVTMRLRMNLGDSTQGFMQLLLVRWPGGKVVVFNAASSHARALAEELARLGVGRLE